MILQHRKIRGHTRQTICAVLVLATLLTLPLLAIAQELSDPLLVHFPSVDSVYKNIKGSDDLETATKQAAAFLFLRNSVKELKPSAFSLSGEYLQLSQIYQAEFKTIYDRAQVEYSDDEDKGRAFYDGHTRLERDNDFRLELYEAFWPELADAYRANLEANDAAEFKKGIEEMKDGAYQFATVVGVAVGVALVVWRLLVMIQRDFVSSKLSSDGKLLVRGKKYQLYKVFGQVHSATTIGETVVSGGGVSGGKRVPVTSRTDIHNNLILLDDEGVQHSIQLTNFNINTIPGNLMTAIWAIKMGKKEGPYIFLYDHDTRMSYKDDTALLLMHLPSWIWVVFPPVLAALAWGVYWELQPSSGDMMAGAITIFILGFLPTILLRALVNRRKVHKFISSDAFQSYYRDDVE